MKPSKILQKMDPIIDILCDGIDDQSCSTLFSSETDPLEELDAQDALEAKQKFCRMNSILFAEPLNNSQNEENLSKDHEECNDIRIIDNVIVSKATGRKYKKYHFNVEDSSPTRCPQVNCLRTFPSKNHLLAHIRRVHCADRNRYICEQCGRGFPERHMLARHAHTHSDQTVQCPVCSVKLRLRTSLPSHLRSHSNYRPHACDICKKTFTRASSKATHVKFVHREGMLECHECHKKFSSRKHWTLHMTTHREKKPD